MVQMWEMRCWWRSHSLFSAIVSCAINSLARWYMTVKGRKAVRVLSIAWAPIRGDISDNSRQKIMTKIVFDFNHHFLLGHSMREIPVVLFSEILLCIVSSEKVERILFLQVDFSSHFILQYQQQNSQHLFVSELFTVNFKNTQGSSAFSIDY